MRITTLFTVLVTAITMRRHGFVRRYIRAVRVIRASIRTFPSTLDHSRAPAFGEALEKCVRHGMPLSEIIRMFSSTMPRELSDSDRVIFLQHLEVVARIYTPGLLKDIHAEIDSLIPNDLSTL